MNLPSVDEARARMLAHVVPLAAENVASDQALGRVLREHVRASRDQPPFAASAMDGWAVRSVDARDAAARLSIVGESAAGRGWDGTLREGQAVRISTGAPLPDGADRVVMQEEASRDGAYVRVEPLGRSSDFVRPRGMDFAAGDPLLAPGVGLDPWQLALAASAGRERLEVGTLPRIALVSTGDEVVEPGKAPGRWQIFDSAGAGLAAWFTQRGCAVARMPPLPDDRQAVTAALRDLPCDLLVTIGGASVGDHDVIKPALEMLGLEMVVEGIAVRPGKPTWFGLLPPRNGLPARRVLGLPGNPVSAMVCAELFGADIVAALQGAAPRDRTVRARLGASMEANGPREHWARAILGRDNVGDGMGGIVATAAADQDSSLVSVLSKAGGLIRRLPYAPVADAGEVVEILILDRAVRA